MDLHAYLRDRGARIEAALDRYLPTADRAPARLCDSMRYSMLAPGKRIRPILVLASAEAVGGDPESVMATACALECIHVFSLIHDDLPCMDDDDYRRGRLTNHKVYGEALALLAGDALFARAFELISEDAARVPPERALAAVSLVARASGTWGMVGGQVMDVEYEGREADASALQYIHSHKTGALLQVSALVGALLCGADETQQAALREYGARMGLAFQIADDILDVEGDEAKLGKSTGKDAAHDKATYPKVFGLEESRRRAASESAAAAATLEQFGKGAEPLRAIARYVVERDL